MSEMCPTLVFQTYLGNLLYSPKDLTDEIVSRNSSNVIIGQVDIQDLVGRVFDGISIDDLMSRKSEELTHSDNLKRMISFIVSTRQNSSVCPIIFNILAFLPLYI